MSSDHHDSHGGAPENKNSLFFLVGIIVIIAVIGIGSTGGPANPITLPGPTQPALFPTSIELPNIPESTPSYRQSILDAPGPIPDRVKKEPQVASLAPWGYALTFASKIKVINQFLEGTSLQRVHTIKTVNVGPDGPMVEQAAVRMTPVEIQELNLKLITYSQHMTGNHVQCYYDEDGGSRHEPDRNIFGPDAIQWNTFRGGAVMNHAIMSTGTLPLEGFNLFMTQPDEAVTPQNGLDCGTQSEFTGHIGLYELGDTEEIYDGTDHNQWTANEFCPAGVLAQYDECMAAPPEPDPNNPGQFKKKSCDMRCSDNNAHTVYSLRLPDADNVNINSGEGPNGEKEGFTLTQLDAVFDFEKGNGYNTQNHTLRIPLCKGCEITSETSVYYLEDNRRTYMLAFNCSLADKYAPGYPEACPTPPPEPSVTPSVAACPSTYFEKFKKGIEYSSKGSPADAGYALAYRSGGTLTAAMKKEAIRLMGPQMMNGGAKGIANINKYWDQISETAKTYKWNPVFIVALWIEESAAGGHPNASHDLGCLYGWDKPNMQGPAVSMPKISSSNVCDQMACLFSHPHKNPDDFSGFMCSYNSDPGSVGAYQCQASSGWPFPLRLKNIYDLLVNAK